MAEREMREMVTWLYYPHLTDSGGNTAMEFDCCVKLREQNRDGRDGQGYYWWMDWPTTLKLPTVGKRIVFKDGASYTVERIAVPGMVLLRSSLDPDIYYKPECNPATKKYGPPGQPKAKPVFEHSGIQFFDGDRIEWSYLGILGYETWYGGICDKDGIRPDVEPNTVVPYRPGETGLKYRKGTKALDVDAKMLACGADEIDVSKIGAAVKSITLIKPSDSWPDNFKRAVEEAGVNGSLVGQGKYDTYVYRWNGAEPVMPESGEPPPFWPNNIPGEYAWQGIKCCPLPPDGWWCKRGAGHGGPCAALPMLPTTDVKDGVSIAEVREELRAANIQDERITVEIEGFPMRLTRHNDSAGKEQYWKGLWPAGLEILKGQTFNCGGWDWSVIHWQWSQSSRVFRDVKLTRRINHGSGSAIVDLEAAS